MTGRDVTARPGIRLAFDPAEYAARLGKTRRAMETAGIELLVVTDPSNMAWLTGYDGWSFYVPQSALIRPDEEPIWFGRAQDVNGAKRTVYMGEDRVLGYPDHYVQSTERHPLDYLARIIAEHRWNAGPIGVEMDSYYFSAAGHRALTTHLPTATFKDATGLVNWQRAVKSPRELAYMRTAARIVEAIHHRIAELIEPGVRKNALVAEIYRTGILGVEGAGGDYPAIVPLLATGADGSAPHLTWDDRPLQPGEGTFFEVAGCYKRYHCPLSRTAFLGTPPQKVLDAEQALLEGIEAGLEAARPGARCEDVEAAWRRVASRYGIEKEGRCGYSIGLSYPPEWGEHTMSFRPGDRTVLEESMTFHFMPGLWFEDWGIEITESIVITQNGAECLANVPRRLVVKT